MFLDRASPDDPLLLPAGRGGRIGNESALSAEKSGSTNPEPGHRLAIAMAVET